MMTKEKLLAVMGDLRACSNSYPFVIRYNNLFELYRDAISENLEWVAWLGAGLEPVLGSELCNELIGMDGMNTIAYGRDYWLDLQSSQVYKRSDILNDLVIHLHSTNSRQEVTALIKRKLPVRKLLRMVEAYYERNKLYER